PARLRLRGRAGRLPVRRPGEAARLAGVRVAPERRHNSLRGIQARREGRRLHVPGPAPPSFGRGLRLVGTRRDHRQVTAAALSLDLRGSDLGLTRVRPRADALASPGEYVPLVGIGTFVRRRGPDAAIVVLIAAGVVETFVRDLPASKAALLALALCATPPLLL